MMQCLRVTLRFHHTSANLLSERGKEAFLQRFAEAQKENKNLPKHVRSSRRSTQKKNDSSVLIPLVEMESRTWIILTQRSFQLKSHRGEVCFPGGRIEDGEDIAQAAVREAFEETGMDPSSVDVWGTMNPVLNRYLTNSITPVVGVVDPAKLSTLAPHCAEVRSIFMVPVDEICAKSGYTNFMYKNLRYVLPVYLSSEYRMIKTSDSCVSGYKEPPVQRIWGLSAAVLHQLLLYLVPQLYDSKLSVPFL
uniref:Nudix hydrolase domain-containing protein n=1 Tax=Steinernema glaseri TaxID=37863 RepID=A0A1I7ZF76_9BILA